jgi:hypothetical protein
MFAPIFIRGLLARDKIKTQTKRIKSQIELKILYAFSELS